jgi:hypothetical protein
LNALTNRYADAGIWDQSAPVPVAADKQWHALAVALAVAVAVVVVVVVVVAAIVHAGTGIPEANAKAARLYPGGRGFMLSTNQHQ